MKYSRPLSYDLLCARAGVPVSVSAYLALKEGTAVPFRSMPFVFSWDVYIISIFGGDNAAAQNREVIHSRSLSWEVLEAAGSQTQTPSPKASAEGAFNYFLYTSCVP